MQEIENSAQTGFNREAYILAHRLESQEVDRIHIWLNKWLIGMARDLLSCHPSSLPSLVSISVTGRLILGQQDEYQQQSTLRGVRHTHLEERVVPQRKVWMLNGETKE